MSSTQQFEFDSSQQFFCDQFFVQVEILSIDRWKEENGTLIWIIFCWKIISRLWFRTSLNLCDARDEKYIKNNYIIDLIIGRVGLGFCIKIYA